MRNKSVKYFNIILSLIYIISVVYFLFNKEYGRAGLSIVSLVILLILNRIYTKGYYVLDKSLYIVSNTFILFSFVLGSSYNLYDKVKNYDDFLHFWSGFISIKIGWNILSLENVTKQFSKPLFFTVLLFFAMGISASCEICEYLLDVVFNMETQSGGLKDTMMDMIDSFTGSLIMIAYYSRKF